MKTIAALFVKKNSVYKTLQDVDCYDIERDALKFPGGIPVVAHPPCRLWGRLYKFARVEDEEYERNLARFAVRMVRENGGVLEHPAHSKLWKDQGLPLPGKTSVLSEDYSMSIDQSWFGYPARKSTWLYIHGLSYKDLPLIPMRLDAITKTVSSTKDNELPEMSKSMRDVTVLPLAEWLVNVARMCK